jgi:hypothetical protein
VKTPDSLANDVIRRLSLVIAALAAVIAIPLILLAVYVDKRFDSVERDLKFVPTELTNAHADDLAWEPVAGQEIYVPAYSHVYHEDGKPLLLTITLSVRNTDPQHEIVIQSVRYFDTQGNEVRSFLDAARKLGPLATAEFLVERREKSGGSGANFLVRWSAPVQSTPPIVEAVMVDTTRGVSFVRHGTVISETEQAEP